MIIRVVPSSHLLQHRQRISSSWTVVAGRKTTSRWTTSPPSSSRADRRTAAAHWSFPAPVDHSHHDASGSGRRRGGAPAALCKRLPDPHDGRRRSPAPRWPHGHVVAGHHVRVAVLPGRDDHHRHHNRWRRKCRRRCGRSTRRQATGGRTARPVVQHHRQLGRGRWPTTTHVRDVSEPQHVTAEPAKPFGPPVPHVFSRHPDPQYRWVPITYYINMLQ